MAIVGRLPGIFKSMCSASFRAWRQVRAWLVLNWFYAGLVAAIFLLVLVPLLWSSWSAVLLITFLQLPVYMFHQVEEHSQDRFRRYLNEHVAAGLDAMTHDAVLVINIGGVWVLDLVVLYLAYCFRPGLGLIAMDLAILNALAHIAMAVVRRSYNPGLISAIFLLLTAGVAGEWIVVWQGQWTAIDQAWGIGVAVAVHAAILTYLRYRIVRIRSLQMAAHD